MKLLNSRYRGTDKVTDVLSFPLTGDGIYSDSAILGDIVICIPQALSQSKKYNITFYNELLRLLIHGLMHLLGYDHEASAYQRRKMKKKEREILNALTTVA
jgi:probable rRNA maturation factor